MSQNILSRILQKNNNDKIFVNSVVETIKLANDSNMVNHFPFKIFYIMLLAH